MRSQKSQKNDDLFFKPRASNSNSRNILPSISMDEYDDNSEGIDTSLNSLCLIDIDAEPAEEKNAEMVARAQSFPFHKTKFPLLERLNLPTEHMRIKKAWSEQEISLPELESEFTKEKVRPTRRLRDTNVDIKTPRLFSRKLPSIEDQQTEPQQTKALH